MPEPKILLGITAVYLIAVILFAVIRGRQPLLPWLICTAFQLGALYHFNECIRLIVGYLRVHPVIFGVKLQTTKADLLLYTAVFCIVINLLLIFALNRIALGLQILRDTRKRVKRLRLKKEQAQVAAQTAENQKLYDQQVKEAALRMKEDMKRRGFDYIQTDSNEREQNEQSNI